MPAGTRSSTEHLEWLRRDALAVEAEVDALVASLDAEALFRRPSPERWSVADCLTHLAVIGDAYSPRIRAALAEYGARQPPSAATHGGEYRPSWVGRLFIRMTGPASRNVKVRARGPFIPPPAGPDAADRFHDSQHQLRELIDAAALADLQRVRITSPLTRLLTLSLGECLEMLVGHERRHLAQMHDIVAELGVPSTRDLAGPGRGVAAS